MTPQSGMWTTISSGEMGAEAVEAVRPALEEAMAHGWTEIDVGGVRWKFSPIAAVTPQESAEPREAVVAALRERLDMALHEWWDHDHGHGTHACRPVPDETEFMAIAERHGITLALAAAPLPSDTPTTIDPERLARAMARFTVGGPAHADPDDAEEHWPSYLAEATGYAREYAALTAALAAAPLPSEPRDVAEARTGSRFVTAPMRDGIRYDSKGAPLPSDTPARWPHPCDQPGCTGPFGHEGGCIVANVTASETLAAAIDLFLEYRDKHGRDEASARNAAILDLAEVLPSEPRPVTERDRIEQAFIDGSVEGSHIDHDGKPIASSGEADPNACPTCGDHRDGPDADCAACGYDPGAGQS